MKKQFLISNEEKNRILGLHESMKPNHGTSILKEEKYSKGDTINLVVKDTDEEVELLVTKRHPKEIYEGKIQNDSIKDYKTKNVEGTLSLKQKHLCLKMETKRPCFDVTISPKGIKGIPTTQTVSGREEM